MVFHLTDNESQVLTMASKKDDLTPYTLIIPGFICYLGIDDEEQGYAFELRGPEALSHLV